jgi:hypothetical protein
MPSVAKPQRKPSKKLGVADIVLLLGLLLLQLLQYHALLLLMYLPHMLYSMI